MGLTMPLKVRMLNALVMLVVFLGQVSRLTKSLVTSKVSVREIYYRRQYDDTVDLTFYVDHDYKVVNLFEGWINYIPGQGEGQRLSNDTRKRDKLQDELSCNL